MKIALDFLNIIINLEINNMLAKKDLLSTTSNPLSKFELGLRIYSSHKNIKNHFE